MGFVMYNDETGDGMDWNIGFANEHDKKYWLQIVLASEWGPSVSIDPDQYFIN
jgi:hypothetical protein